MRLFLDVEGRCEPSECRSIRFHTGGRSAVHSPETHTVGSERRLSMSARTLVLRLYQQKHATTTAHRPTMVCSLAFLRFIRSLASRSCALLVHVLFLSFFVLLHNLSLAPRGTRPVACLIHKNVAETQIAATLKSTSDDDGEQRTMRLRFGVRPNAIMIARTSADVFPRPNSFSVRGGIWKSWEGCAASGGLTRKQHEHSKQTRRVDSRQTDTSDTARETSWAGHRWCCGTVFAMGTTRSDANYRRKC